MNKKLGVLQDNRSELEKKGELRHKHLVGVTAPFKFEVINQNLWPVYTQRNQFETSACTDFSSATCYEANTGVVASARPPYANRPNSPSEGAIPSVTAALWMHPGTTTETLCPSDNLTEKEIDVKFIGATPLVVQNYVLLDNDINEYAEAIQNYKAICIDVDVAWTEWQAEKGVPQYIPGAPVDGGHQMAGVLALSWAGQNAILMQQSWGLNDPDSLPNDKVSNVVFTEEFLKNRSSGGVAYIFRPATPENQIVSLKRTSDDGVETLGTLSIGDFVCDTLERPWKNNQVNVSCIPKGSYNVAWSFMNDLNEYHYQIESVPGRTGIFIHEGNFYENTEGCILLGNSFGDINADGQPDALNSKVTLAKFETRMAQQPFTLVIQ